MLLGTPTWWPNLPESWQKIEIFSWSEAWNLPTWGCKSMVEGLTICWECSSLCYTPIQCQTSTILASLHLLGTPTWWPNLPESWQKIEIFSWSEAWNLPTWGCKSMVEGLTIVLGVFITLLYTYTMPNNYYSSKPTSLRYPHLMAKLAWELAENRYFFLIWGMKPANMGL